MVRKPEETIDGIIRSETAAEDLTQLMRTFGKTPEGKASMKKHVVDRFLETAKKQGETIDPAIVGEFKRVRKALEESKLLTADEADTIASVLGMTGSTKLRRGAGAQPYASLDKSGKLLSSAAAALAMKVLPGNSLIMAGATKQFMKDQMLKSPDPNIMAALEKMISDPRKFEAAVRKYNPQDGIGMKAMLKAILKDVLTYPLGVSQPAAMVVSGGKEEKGV
jgi:hypothetical protein